MVNLFSKSASVRKPYKRSVSLFKEGSGHGRNTNEGWTLLQIDKRLAFITFVFLCLGLIFTYSSSAFDSMSYFQRQLIFDIIGVMLALFLSQTYTRLQSLVKPIWMVWGTWVLLLAVLFVSPIANVHRWIPIGPFNLQPSEIAKVTLVIYLADYLSKVQGQLARNWFLLVKPLGVSGITFLLILKEPDLGTVLLLGGVMVMMLFAAGASWKQIFSLFSVAIPFVAYQLIFYPYRLKRVLSFLNPEAYIEDAGYQLSYSFWAVGSGGWFGKGLGNSEMKLEYLPAAHTDFIFSVICEEGGLLIGLIIIGLFCWLLSRGIGLARSAKNGFHSLLMFGLTLTLTAQAFFNMSMAIGILPPKGIALPFFSYGGSSVIITLMMLGIIANLAAQSSLPRKGRREEFSEYRTRNYR